MMVSVTKTFYRLHDLNIRQKLLLSYFILIIIPISAITLFSYYKISGIIENQAIQTSNQALEQAKAGLSLKINSALDASNIAFKDSTLRDILGRDIRTYDINQQIDDLHYLEAFTSNLESNSDIYRVRIYLQDGLIYSQQSINLFNMKELVGSSWLNKVESESGKLYIVPFRQFPYILHDNRDIISFARVIRDFHANNSVIGLVSIDILESTIRQVLQAPYEIHKGVYYIVNSEGAIISSIGEAALNMNQTDLTFHQTLIRENKQFDELRLHGEKYLTGLTRIPETDWRLVSVIPMSGLLSENVGYRNHAFFLMIIIGVIAYLLAYYISFINTKRIRQLTVRMRKVQDGNLEKVRVDGSDEIGELQEDYNYMLDQISLLLREKYFMGKEVRNLELKALQSQINPHFLYNTLDLIYWIAMKHKVTDITYLVNKLAKYYKLSLSKGKDIIPISDEIEHVRTYVEIQNKRFDDNIELKLDIDEQIYHYYIPKLVLQPLVENSILHGIMEKETRKGNIYIMGRLVGQMIVLVIEDNGVGISKEKMQSVFPVSRSGVNGYGISNTHDRIRLLFGDQYGLSYESHPGMGTKVRIEIPALELDTESA